MVSKGGNTMINMDERILVETCLPVVQMRFDAGLASSLTIQQAMQLLYEAAMQQVEKGVWIPKPILLYNASNNCVLRKDSTIKEARVQSGDCIYLF